jgi:hypothetical protein
VINEINHKIRGDPILVHPHRHLLAQIIPIMVVVVLVVGTTPTARIEADGLLLVSETTKP